jgi:hypothetical protein
VEICETGKNPADEASRGLSIQKLFDDSNWLTGQDFLRMPDDTWNKIVPSDILAHDACSDESDVNAGLGFVRSVQVKTQTSQFRRPISKLVLLVANDA